MACWYPLSQFLNANPQLTTLLQSSQGSILEAPCFLDSAAWQTAVDSPLPGSHQQLESHSKLSIVHFNLMTQLSILQQDIFHPTHGQMERTRLSNCLWRLYELRAQFKQALHATSRTPSIQAAATDTIEARQDCPIIFCKHALGHISVNMLLLHLKRSPLRRTSPRLRQGQLDESYTWNIPYVSARYLNTEIDALMELVSSSFRKAVLVTPMACYRMASSYRVICARMFQQKTYHPVWKRINSVICEGNVE